LPFIYSLLLFSFLFCQALTAAALEIPSFDENIHISADRMSQTNLDGTYTADGNVVVIWNGLNLTADHLKYAATTHVLNANGSVTMTKGPTVLKGKTLVMNMESGMAEIDSTLLTLPETGMNASSKQLIRLSENEFSAISTELTTCDMPDPSWKLGADKLNINLLGYATGRNVIFYVKDIPVLYIPWLAFPVVTEKRSGLLFPRFGYSKGKGAEVDIPAYWVISPSQDLLIDLDIMTRRGVGTGADYRYIRKRGSEGHINLYPIYDQVENRWRWQLAQEHKEIFSKDLNLRMTVNVTSDRKFLNDFGEKSGEYNQQSSDTTINALKTWQNYALTSYLRYNEDLYAVDNRSTLQTLPSLGVAAVRQSLFSMPLYFDLDSSAANFYRETGVTGQRLDLFPRITMLPFKSDFLQTSMYFGAHIRGYNTDLHNSSSSIQSQNNDLLPEAGIRMSTSLSRIYNTDFLQLKKIRHELIPEIRYGFVPQLNQQRLPFYDYSDRIIHQNMITLSATSVINGKFISGDTTEYRDISRIKLSADYKADGERRDLLTLVESQHQWSDLILESETTLTKHLRVTFDTRYNIYEKLLSTAVVGIESDDRQGNIVGAGYQMARNKVEYFEGRVSTKLIKPLNLSYTARYSFDRSAFLESVYALEYRQKCWSVNLATHQRPGSQSYTVNFNLAGLGSK
jgi:LPS-assembly protein